MKISNSKKELARIISENGGWRDGAKWAAMDKTDGHCNSNSIGFFRGKYRPECYGTIKMWRCRYIETEFMGCEKSIICEKIIGNWHQSCLSREEYFHLYPAPDADGWIEWNGGECPVEKGTMIDVRYRFGKENIGVTALIFRGNDGFKSGLMHNGLSRVATHWMQDGSDMDIIAYRLHKPEQSNPEFCESVTRSIPEPKPTIDQLAADYRNRNDYADRKQQEADAAKADAEAKLAELVSAGKALNLVISFAEKEPELVITDWRDLQVGDVIKVYGHYWDPDCEYVVDENDLSKDMPVNVGGYWAKIGVDRFEFIRRP